MTDEDLNPGEAIPVSLLADGEYHVLMTESLKAEDQKTVALSKDCSVWQIGIAAIYCPRSHKCFMVLLDLPKLANAAKASVVPYFKRPSNFREASVHQDGLTLRKSSEVVELCTKAGNGMLAVQASYEL